MYKDVQLLHISEKCRSLVQLDLTWCEKITDLGIINMSKGCSNLTDLSLAYCEGVGSPGVTAIAENCPHIHTLDLTGEPHMLVSPPRPWFHVMRHTVYRLGCILLKQ
jgi:hypothetical protein